MENIQKESKPKNTYHRERYMKNREKLIAYQKQWNAINNYRSPDKILRQRQYNKEYYQKNKHRWTLVGFPWSSVIPIDVTDFREFHGFL